MKRRKFSGKRLMAAVLTAAMMLSLVPATAFAANEDEGEWSVPVKMMNATKEGQASMGDKAIDGNATVTIKDGKSAYAVNFKGIEFSGLYGHLLKLWHYPDYSADSDSVTGTVAAVPSNKYQDTNLSGKKDSFYKTFTMTRDGAKKEDMFFIRISVDAMAGFDQDAKLVFDWKNAKKLGDEQKPEPKPEPKPIKFVDVKSTDWFAKEVDYVVAKGLMNGTGNNMFSPDVETSRGMIVSMLYRMAGEPAVEGNPSFSDVKAGDWYANGVIWASQNGISQGTSATRFGPNDRVSREEMVTMLYNYAKYRGNDVDASATLDGFKDANTISANAVTPMRWAVGNEIISGVGNNRIAPKGNTTRAQLACIFMRFCENVEK